MNEASVNERPKNLYLRGGVWYVDLRRGRGHRVRVSTGTSNVGEAMATVSGMRLSIAEADRERWREFMPATESELLLYLAKGLERARKRDRKRDRLCELTPDDIRALLKRSGNKCELTGIPFSLDKAVGTWRRPFAPSLDRIRRDEPYRPSNCRLVGVAANIGLNEWGESVFRRIAIGFLAKDGHSVDTNSQPENAILL